MAAFELRQLLRAQIRDQGDAPAHSANEPTCQYVCSVVAHWRVHRVRRLERPLRRSLSLVRPLLPHSPSLLAGD